MIVVFLLVFEQIRRPRHIVARRVDATAWLLAFLKRHTAVDHHRVVAILEVVESVWLHAANPVHVHALIWERMDRVVQLEFVLSEMIALALRRLLTRRVQEITCSRHSCGIGWHIDFIDIFKSTIVATILFNIIVVALLFI